MIYRDFNSWVQCKVQNGGFCPLYCTSIADIIYPPVRYVNCKLIIAFDIFTMLSSA